jgi:hypothetical protein
LGIAVILGSLLPGHSAAEDFLERMKKAAEQLQQQEQRQRLQQSQPQRQPTDPSARTASPQPVSQGVQASAGMSECCTPEATSKMAASAGFVDILGIKPGMRGEQAIAALKAVNPNMKIEILRSQANWDYMAGLTEDSRTDPKKLWAYGIQATAPVTGPGAPETIFVSLTAPPNPPLVYGVARNYVSFRQGAMPTIENLVAGLRKKYGEENYYEPTGVELEWVFDSQGQPVSGRPGREIATHCKGMFLNPEVPDLRGGRELLNRTGGAFVLPQGDPRKLHTCSEWVLVNVKILRAPRVSATDSENPLATDMETHLAHFPLFFSGLHVTYDWIDQVRKGQSQKKVKEAEKVDLPKF